MHQMCSICVKYVCACHMMINKFIDYFEIYTYYLFLVSVFCKFIKNQQDLVLNQDKIKKIYVNVKH